MKRFQIILVTVACLVVLTVVTQNTQSVQTKLLFVTFTMPRALLLIITFLAGCVTGLVVALQIRRVRSEKKP